MIGKITGIVDYIESNETVLVNVNNISYVIHFGNIDIKKITLGAKITIWTYIIFSNNEPKLFGFLSQSHKECFILLLKINGVSGKISLSIVGNLGYKKIITAIESGDLECFNSISGIGKKISNRIINEGRDLLKNQLFAGIDDSGEIAQESLKIRDTKMVLEKLGYSKSQIDQSLEKMKNFDINISELIKEAIRNCR